MSLQTLRHGAKLFMVFDDPNPSLGSLEQVRESAIHQRLGLTELLLPYEGAEVLQQLVDRLQIGPPLVGVARTELAAAAPFVGETEVVLLGLGEVVALEGWFPPGA